MPRLTVTVIEATSEQDAHDSVVRFSCWDDDSIGMVAFESTIDVAHAVYLVEHQMISDKTAYGKLLHAINQNGIDQLKVGKVFTS